MIQVMIDGVTSGDLFLYAACVSGAIGCMIQLILSGIYNRNLRASDGMRNVKTAWMKQMRTRYEAYLQWNDKMQNIDLFVDKHISRQKLLGVYLGTWEEYSRLMVPITVMFGAIGAAFTYAAGLSVTEILLRLTSGIILAVVCKIVIAGTNLREKRVMLRVNLKDYFENSMQRQKKRPVAFEPEELPHSSELEQQDCRRETKKAPETEPSVEAEFASTVEGICPGTVQLKHRSSSFAAARQSRAEIKKNRAQEKEMASLLRAEKKRSAYEKKERVRMEKLAHRMQKMQQRLGTASVEGAAPSLCITDIPQQEKTASEKREELKRKVGVEPEEEDRIISEVLKEFLA